MKFLIRCAIGLGLAGLLGGLAHGETITGTVKRTDGAPIPYAFVGVQTHRFQTVGTSSTGPDGSFSIEADLGLPLESGYLIVQPPPKEDNRGYGILSAQPRIYRYPPHAGPVDIRLPPAGCLVLLAYDKSGKVMRWNDFRALGVFGEQFVYATDLEDRLRPAVCWHVCDAEARAQGSAREKSLPALVVEPGDGYVAQALFWEVGDYGKLLLRADNAGKGFRIRAAGDARILELNVELARTAVADLVRRSDAYPEAGRGPIAPLQTQLDAALGEPDPARRAAAADGVLAVALRLRDTLEVEAARAAIPKLRTGTVTLHVQDASGAAAPGCAVRLEHRSRDFLFGVFEGSPYNAKAFETARKAGFELATLLLGWNWTEGKDGQIDQAGVDQVFGVSDLGRLGYTVKAHGVVWLQQYGILPDRAFNMKTNELCEAELAHEKAMLDTFGDQIALWEVMNEPAATNVVNMPRDALMGLFAASSQTIGAHTGLRSLVNGAHEGDYGRKFLFFGLNNAPLEDFNETYLSFLERAQAAGALGRVDAVGLQFYPGFRFNETFGGLQGPAYTPSWLVDTIERYKRFGKPVHITEFSLPSTYGSDWFAGYWREPWNESAQADYVEAVFTLAFGTPGVESLTWWDVSDAKPSVITGGLIAKDGKPKPAFERVARLLGQWKTDEVAAKTDASGNAALSGYAGRYAMEVRLPNGDTLEGELHLSSGENAALTLAAQPRGPKSGGAK